MSFYAYIHCKPDGTPFYVGKGNDARVSHVPRKENVGHCRTVSKYGLENILVGKMECSTEDIAYDLERGLIKRLRKMGLNIVNCNSGGRGGYSISEETRAKMAASKVGNQWNVGREYSLATKIKKSRSKGGSAVECEKDGVVLKFPTITEACKALGLNLPNVVNHLRRKTLRKSSGVKGWKIKKIPDDY